MFTVVPKKSSRSFARTARHGPACRPIFTPRSPSGCAASCRAIISRAATAASAADGNEAITASPIVLTIAPPRAAMTPPMSWKCSSTMAKARASPTRS